MMCSGVHDQNLCSSMGFLDHVGQVMAIVFGQGCTQDYKVKGALAQSFPNVVAVDRSRYLMACFFHLRSLAGKRVFVTLGVKNCDCRFREGLVSGFVRGIGQGSSWDSFAA